MEHNWRDNFSILFLRGAKNSPRGIPGETEIQGQWDTRSKDVCAGHNYSLLQSMFKQGEGRDQLFGMGKHESESAILLQLVYPWVSRKCSLRK